MRANCIKLPNDVMRLLIGTALALLCPAALSADQVACKEASGGRMQGLKSAVIWHARTACGGSSMLWLQSFAGAQGKDPVWRIDDLLIIPDTEDAQTLSVFARPDVDCRHGAGKDALVIAAGNWNPRAAPGARQPAARAWRVNPETRKLEELAARDVSCAVR